MFSAVYISLSGAASYYVNMYRFRVMFLLAAHCTARLGDTQGRRHGFESGGTILRAERAKKNFLTPTFWPVGGQNIA